MMWVKFWVFLNVLEVGCEFGFVFLDDTGTSGCHGIVSARTPSVVSGVSVPWAGD